MQRVLAVQEVVLEMNADNKQNEVFPVRFGLSAGTSVNADFPQEARIGLWHVLKVAVDDGRTRGWSRILDEILRLLRKSTSSDGYEDPAAASAGLLRELSWERAYVFCERAYEVLLTPEVSSDFNGNEFEIVALPGFVWVDDFHDRSTAAG